MPAASWAEPPVHASPNVDVVQFGCAGCSPRATRSDAAAAPCAQGGQQKPRNTLPYTLLQKVAVRCCRAGGQWPGGQGVGERRDGGWRRFAGTLRIGWSWQAMPRGALPVLPAVPRAATLHGMTGTMGGQNGAHPSTPENVPVLFSRFNQRGVVHGAAGAGSRARSPTAGWRSPAGRVHLFVVGCTIPL